MPTLISDKYKNISKKITRDREGYYLMINGSIHQDDMPILNIYEPKKELQNTQNKN